MQISPSSAGGFRKELLPPASVFYEREFSHLGRPSRGWVRVRCCFHRDKTPSLSLNLNTGGFCCFGCGARGGDVIDFLMLRDNLEFKSAAKGLGAWDLGADAKVARMQSEARQREQERRHAYENKERRLRLDLNAELSFYNRILHEAWRTQTDHSWGIAANAFELRRRVAAGHALLAFGPTTQRKCFVEGDDIERENIITEIVNSGYVRDDKGYSLEVEL